MVNSYSDAELQRGAGNDPLGSFPSDRFVARHVPLVFLISVAFDFDTAHVDPSEEWQDDQLYDIAATVPGNRQLTLEEIRRETTLTQVWPTSLPRFRSSWV